MSEELTTQILIEIRDGIRQTNERIGSTNERLDKTNERLDKTNERLDRVVQEQIRHATAIVGLERAQRDMIDALMTMNANITGLNDRLDHVLIGPLGTTVRKHTDDIDDLRRRLEVLEKRTG